jgi:hypothetical protein
MNTTFSARKVTHWGLFKDKIFERKFNIRTHKCVSMFPSQHANRGKSYPEANSRTPVTEVTGVNK